MAKIVNKKILSIVLSIVIVLVSVGGVLAVVLLHKGSKEQRQETAVVNLKIWHTFTGNAKTVFEKDVVAAFKQKNKNIRLMPVKMECSVDKLQSAVEAGKGPDMIVIPSEGLSDLAEKDLIENLVGKRNFDKIKAAQFNQLYEGVKVDNGYYGIPMNALVDVALYNKSALGDTQLPVTQDDLLALKGKIGIDGYNGHSLLSLFYSAGGQVMKEDKTTAVGYLDSKVSIMAMKSLLKMKSHFCNFEVEKALENPIAGLASGDYLMTVANSRVFSALGADTNGLVAAPVPTANGAESKALASCDAAAVMASSKLKDEAWQFIEFLASDETQAVMAKSGNLPANDSAAQMDTTKSLVPFSEVYLGALGNSQTCVTNRKQNTVMSFVDKAFENIFTGAKEVNEMLSFCAPQIDAIINNEHLPLDAADLTLEAESGRLEGSAEVCDETEASGGKFVRSLNWETGEPNRLVFDNLPLDKRGTYEVRFCYSSGTNGGIGMFVNGIKLACPYTYTDLTWKFVTKIVTMEIPFKGDGSDNLEFFDVQNGCYVFLDYIQFVFLNDHYEEPEDISKPINDGRIEAESGGLIGKSQIWESFLASGGKYVVWLNADLSDPNNPKYPNRLRFDNSKLNVTKPGVYEFTMGYSCGVAGVLGVDVNGKQEFFAFSRTTPADNDWNYVPSTFKFRLKLKGDGTDIIEFYDATNYIWMDYFRMEYIGNGQAEKGDGRIEAEDGEMSGEAHVWIQAGSSGNRVVTSLDASEGNANRVTFRDLPVQGAGTYTLNVVYSTVMDGTLLAIVNGMPMEMPWTVTDETGTWLYKSGTLSIDVPLRGDGTDTISFAIKNKNEYLWLDYIHLKFKSADIVKPEGRFEAESGTLGGSAVVEESRNASDGKYVTGLNSAADNPNFICFGGELGEKSGIYDLSFAYSAAQAGILGVELNGVHYEVPYGLTDANGTYSLNSTMLWRVPLKGDGSDTVKLYDIEGTIALDYVQITYKGELPPSYLYEGEKAEFHGAATGWPASQGESSNEKFSGGGYAYNFDYGKPDSFVRFKKLGVTVENAGRYKVTISVKGNGNGNVGIRANGYEVIAPFTVDPEKTAAPNAVAVAEIALRGGNDDYIDVYVPDAATGNFLLDTLKIEYIGEDVSDLCTDRLEAENAIYDESIAPRREESNGSFIVDLPADGTVKFLNVETSALTKKGVYTIKVGYRTETEGAQIQATVTHPTENPNGSTVLMDLLTSEGVMTVSKNITLQSDGTDSIQLKALNGKIAVDYISFTYFGEIIPGITLEAEDAKADLSIIVNDAKASNGKAVSGLQDGKTLTYENVVVPASGIYQLYFQYKAEKAGKIQVTVDGRPAQIIDCEAAEDYTATAKLNVGLKGNNTDTIVITDAEAGKSITLDFMVLQYMKPVIVSNKPISVEDAVAYGSASIASGKAIQMNSSDEEGKNFDDAQAFVQNGDSYVAFENLPMFVPGWYHLRLDAELSADAQNNGWNTNFIVTVNPGAEDTMTTGYVIGSTGYTDSMPIYLCGNGTDTIRIEEMSGGLYTFGSLKNIVLSPIDVDYFAEAEEADEVNGTIHVYDVKDAMNRPFKASGLTYVDSFHESNGEGLIFRHVNVDEAGDYYLTIRALNACIGNLSVIVNGVQTLAGLRTLDWDVFVDLQVKVALNAGDNEIQIKYGDAGTYAAIDYMYITAENKHNKLVEFEDSTHVTTTSGGVQDVSNASGGKVLNNINSGTVTITLPQEKTAAGHYHLNFGLVSVFNVDIAVKVNDQSFILPLSKGGANYEYAVCNYYGQDTVLRGDGSDKIELILTGNWAWLDYLYFEYEGEELPLI